MRPTAASRALILSLAAALTLTACATDSTDDDAATAAEAGGEGRPDPATEHSEGAHDDAATAQAADLRAGLNTLLAEHVFFAGAAVNEALQGNTAGFEAAAGALDENSVALSEAVGSVYGADAGDAFLGLWRSHIGMFVDYTTATAAGDTAAQEQAVQELTGYADDFAAFLSGANPNLPRDTVRALVVEHVVSTKAAVDALAAGDAVQGFAELRKAIGHMHMIADPLSAAIAVQFPEHFSADASEAASALRTQLNVKLAEHVWLAGAAVNEAAKGNTAAFEAAAGALDRNSQDLAGMIGSVYGPEAGEAFLGLWRAHIGMFVDYTQGKLAGDEAKVDKAEQDLDGYSRDFAVFLNGANENLPVEDVQGLLEEHVASTKGAIDAVVSGEGNPFVALREAGQHMSHIADPLAEAIAAQHNL